VLRRSGHSAQLRYLLCGIFLPLCLSCAISASGPKPTSNHFRRCCGAARQTGLSLHVRNSMMSELTMCGLIELSLRLRSRSHLTAFQKRWLLGAV
jgi:hypothetical protein